MNIANLNTNQPTSVRQQSPVDIKLTGEVKCECGGIAFQEAVIFRSVSALLSPSGKAGFMPVSSWCCASCGNIPQDFLPIELKTPKLT